MSRVNIVHSLAEADWRSFIAENPNSNIFHSPEMFEVFERTKGYRPTLWAAVDHSGYPLVLLLPVEITLLNGLMRRFTTRAVVFGSVLCAPGPVGLEALAILLKAYASGTRGALLFTELRNLADLGELLTVLNEHGFVYEPHLNYLINLNCTAEEVFQNIGRRTRKNIRHGLKRGAVVIEEIKELEQIAECYDLLRRTYHAAQVPLADRSLFESAFKSLYSKGMIRLTGAYVGGVPVAISVDLLYKGVIYGWYGGMDRSYGSYVPNELLMWHILEWGAKNGYRLYDFGGAGKPNEEYGVREFKAKFGGVLVSYGRHSRVSNPVLFRIGKLGYNLYRCFL